MIRRITFDFDYDENQSFSSIRYVRSKPKLLFIKQPFISKMRK